MPPTGNEENVSFGVRGQRRSQFVRNLPAFSINRITPLPERIETERAHCELSRRSEARLLDAR